MRSPVRQRLLVPGGMALALIGCATATDAMIPAQTVDLVPPGFTDSLDAVPNFAPPSIKRPYRLAWQKQLLAFQVEFQAALAGTMPVDPIETGSITDRD